MIYVSGIILRARLRVENLQTPFLQYTGCFIFAHRVTACCNLIASYFRQTRICVSPVFSQRFCTRLFKIKKAWADVRSSANKLVIIHGALSLPHTKGVSCQRGENYTILYWVYNLAPPPHFA